MTTVQLQTIVQKFGRRRVLDQLDLTVESGQYVVLLGESGCGKTTTLRIIAGLQSPTSGSVLFDGKCVDAIQPRHRDVAMVFQHGGLYPHLTVAESIRFALRRQVDADQLRSRVDQAVGLTGIEAILDRYPSRLSGGELRRAALAKAIARRSSVRLLDEPLSALDAPVRHELQNDILRWHATAAGTTIHVTHDGLEAMRMADKIAVMESGHVVQYASPAEIFARPNTVSVARATGAPPINLFPTRLRCGRIEVCNPDISFHTSVTAAGPDRDVLIGVRPDMLRVVPRHRSSNGEPNKDGLVITGRVLRCRSVLRDLHLHLRAGDDSILAILPEQSFEPAETIRLEAAGGIHCFDVQSGQRIEL
jgi:ABC-type sugar transport system ATPase subunit